MNTFRSALTKSTYVLPNKDQTAPIEDEILSERIRSPSSTTNEMEHSQRKMRRFDYLQVPNFNSQESYRSFLHFPKPHIDRIVRDETEPIEQESDLEKYLEGIFAKIFKNSHDEIFEDGMNSVFHDQLKDIILTYGNPTIRALERVMDVNMGEVTEEALIQLGKIKDSYTHHRRLDLLKRKFRSSNSRIRDSALLGIASMNDPTAIPNLDMVLRQEKDQQMQQNIKAVLQQLQNK